MNPTTIELCQASVRKIVKGTNAADHSQYMAYTLSAFYKSKGMEGTFNYPKKGSPFYEEWQRFWVEVT